MNRSHKFSRMLIAIGKDRHSTYCGKIRPLIPLDPQATRPILPNPATKTTAIFKGFIMSGSRSVCRLENLLPNHAGGHVPPPHFRRYAVPLPVY
jgi:hypothetical protein